MVILTEHATLLKNGDKISLYPTFSNLLIIIKKIIKIMIRMMIMMMMII